MGQERTGLHEKHRKCRYDTVCNRVLGIIARFSYVWGTRPAFTQIAHYVLDAKNLFHMPKTYHIFAPFFKFGIAAGSVEGLYTEQCSSSFGIFFLICLLNFETLPTARFPLSGAILYRKYSETPNLSSTEQYFGLMDCSGFRFRTKILRNYPFMKTSLHISLISGKAKAM
jgi:hypothetical protein